MLTRMRTRASDEGGFTLIELLVVILIIGILAAIAIPAFLSQTKKAYDSSAKTLAQTAQTAAETYGTENGGSYASLNVEALHKIEPTIPKEGTTNANGPALVSPTTGTSDTYEVTAEAQSTGDKFTIKRTSEGITERTCTEVSGAGTNGCKNGSW